MFTETQIAVPTSEPDATSAQVECRTPAAPAAPSEAEPATGKPRIVEEVIIEEVSIDGMCGVY
jgi:mycofactocin precursor